MKSTQQEQSARSSGLEQWAVTQLNFLGLQACTASAGLHAVDGWAFKVDTEQRNRIAQSMSFQAKFSENAKTSSVQVSSLEFDFLIIIIAQWTNGGHLLNTWDSLYVIPRDALNHRHIKANKDGSYSIKFAARDASLERYRDIPKQQAQRVWQPVIDFFKP